MILADTTVWIDHFRSRNNELDKLLNRGQILMHPFVVAELALGSLKDRANVLAMLDFLPQAQVALLKEVRVIVETRRLHGLGIGFVDAHLLASVFLNPSTSLWTRDKSLRRVAETLGIHANLP